MNGRREEELVDLDDDRRDLLVEAQAAGLTYEAAGELIGRSARTVRRWAADPEIKRRVSERRHEMAAMAAGRFTALLDKAIGVIDEALHHPSAAVRLRAVNAAFSNHFRFTNEIAFREQLKDLGDQLDELRAHQAVKEQDQ